MLLSHFLQLQADYALRMMERNGLHIDRPRLRAVISEAETNLSRCKDKLGQFGVAPGPGVKKAEAAQFSRIEQEAGIQLPKTPKGAYSTRADVLKDYSKYPFVEALLGYKKAEKLLQAMTKLDTESGRIFPRYQVLVNTGRTSSSSPNIQNLPRGGGVRECIIPAPGHVFFNADYSGLEMCTLAQTCINRYGVSEIANKINAGIDLHKFGASQVLGIPEEQVDDESRRKMKAVNFGFPGGLQPRALVEYAKATYGVRMTEQEAEVMRSRWLELFPEMQSYLAECNDLEAVCRRLTPSAFPFAMAPDMAAKVLFRIASGATESRAEKPYSKKVLVWAWRFFEEIAVSQSQKRKVAQKQGGREILDLLRSLHTVSLPSGRIRSRCRYTQAMNTPFQGMAADGCKIALYRLVKAGFRVTTFVHDEVLVELPFADDYQESAEQIERIMIESMRDFCPDVRISVDYSISSRWSKYAEKVKDSTGRLICWSPSDD